MSPAHGPRRRPGTLRLLTAAVVAALVLGGAVGYGADVWDQVTRAGDHPAATAPPGHGPGAPARGGSTSTAPDPTGTAGTTDDPHAFDTSPAESTSALRLGGPVPDLPADPDPDDVAAAATGSVVTIWTDIPSNSAGLRVRGAGTGIVLTDDGVVLTNNHVITGTSSITATRTASGVDYPARVIGYDRTRDVALLQLDGAEDLPPAALGDARDLYIDQPVVAVGNAGGTGALITSPGTVSGFDQSISAQDPDGTSERLDGVIRIAADINPGDSGGPLLDMRGRVVGVNTAKSESAEREADGGTGYAVPIGDALRVARAVLGEAGADAPTVHVGETALLGVHVRTREAEQPRGAEVLDVVPGSPAVDADIAEGDVITVVDGNRIESANDLSSLIDKHSPGDVLDVHWVDPDGDLIDAKVTLGEGLPR